jgi:hypothetical protein
MTAKTLNGTRRPVYLESEQQDDLVRLCLRLLNEVWTLRDRLTVVEALLEAHAGIPRESIETYVPEGKLADELSTERLAMIKRVMDAPFEGEPLS